MNLDDLARRLEEHLALKAPPIALVFSTAPLPGVARVAHPEAAGCAYWRRAANGEVFHTLPEDHDGCAVGAYTHGAELGETQKTNLEQLIATMAGLEYLPMADVALIPHRAERLAVVTYAPLAKSPAPPSVVLVRCSARAAMLLGESAHSAGVKESSPWGMRPACAIVPELSSTGRASSSLGCIGNRVHTELPDDEMWWGAPGDALPTIVDRLDTIARANRELEAFHRTRAAEAQAR